MRRLSLRINGGEGGMIIEFLISNFGDTNAKALKSLWSSLEPSQAL
jgi:hypothetical protein